jgi:DNA repair exonuclease SbcCD ATPase subunit
MNLEKEYKMFYINNKSKYEKKNENIVSSIKKLNINYNINDIEVNTSTEDLLKEPQLFYKSMLWISLNHQTFAHNSKVNENMNKNLIELKEKYSKTKQELKEDIQSNENDLQKEYKKQREIEQIEGEIKEYRRKLSANKFVDSLLSDLKDEVKNELLNDKELLNDTNEISKISEKLKELKNTKNKLTYKISTLQSKVRIYGNKDIEINNNFNNYYKTDYNRQINDNTNDLIMLMFLLDSYDKENSEHLKYIDSGIDSTFSNSYDDNSTHNHHSSSDFDYSNSSFNDWTSSNYGESSYSSDSGSSYSSDSGSSYSSDSGSSYSSDSGSSYSSD